MGRHWIRTDREQKKKGMERNKKEIKKKMKEEINEKRMNKSETKYK